MKFNKISIILSLLFLNLKVQAEPLIVNELSSNLKRDKLSTKQEVVTDILKEDDTSPFDDTDDEINVTDAVIEEDIDSASDDDPIDSKECDSEECIEISKRILSSLDTSVNPCDDFYEFSCGGWKAMNNDKPYNYSRFLEMETKVKNDLYEILRGDYKVNDKLSQKDREYDEKLFNKMKNYFSACSNFVDTKFDNDDFIVEFVKSFNITESLAKPDGLTNLLADFHNNSFNIFFLITPKVNNESYETVPSINVNLEMDTSLTRAYTENELSKEGLSWQGGFKDENEYNTYLKKQNKLIENRKEYIKNVLQALNFLNEDEINSVAESVIEVEKKISHVLLDTDEKDSIPVPIYSEEPYNNENDDYIIKSTHSTSIKELNENYPLINWKLFFEKLFKSNDIEIPVSEEMTVEESVDFKVFYKYLKEINKDDIAHYIEWKIIESSIQNLTMFGLTEELQTIILMNKMQNNGDYMEGFENSFMEKRSEKSRIFKRDELSNGEDLKSLLCMEVISGTMPLAISKYYVETKFQDQVKSEAMDMLENIRKVMMKRIQEIEWLDESTRKYAIEKVSKIEPNVGYYNSNVESLYNRYEFVNFDNPLSFMLSFGKAIKKNYYAVLNNNNTNNEIIQSYSINAYYDAYLNTIKIPAAVLQSPEYDVNQPDYINYGSIGHLMGHELTHAFDKNGKELDANGNMNSWWTDNDNKEFDEFSQCFIDQYNGFYEEFEGKKYYINGKQTLNENLADNGGINRAYEAWKLSIENNPEKALIRNMKLPGLSDYTMEQLFYISYAQSNCKVNSTNEEYENSHPPSKVRVNGTVSNSKRFAKAFNCPAKSPLNPDIKCELW